jgi:hypothetical protein
MWEDLPLPEDDAIKAAHPLRSGRHDLYAEAMRLVGERHAKAELVELVNWLLVEIAEARRVCRLGLVQVSFGCFKDHPDKIAAYAKWDAETGV